ncbi:argonaute [Schizosaccharomyces cryophilus OY26]|uniref:Argonaute n=1 Tax=Schizosaccharomyces cryophilus (strain OY26 / ATCC MYA-4695 / CBS 11777 / NBRC 106824 / NRRL Y48691) TaxID=653667 RepID=S9VUZ6_SCHCR|nr:argonaute [Schizosaccharomyces cryophilus OY26]EPY50009.1 argonaute [Schizosaccharomyces cryophilus OY26]
MFNSTLCGHVTTGTKLERHLDMRTNHNKTNTFSDQRHVVVMDVTPYKLPTDSAVRPGYGKLGRPVNLKANFYKITVLPRHTINQYHVIIGDGSRLPRKLVEKIWNSKELKDKLGSSWRSCVYDGKSLLWTKDNIPDFFIKVNIGNLKREQFTEFGIQKTTTINLQTLTEFVNSKYALDPHILNGIMFLDLLLKKQPSETLYGFMRSFFTGENTFLLGNGVEAWKGFYQTIRPTQGCMSVNVDISSSAFWRDGSFLSLLLEYTNSKDVRNLTRVDFNTLSRKFRLLKVTCKHRNNQERQLSKKVYSIQGFSSKSASASTFVRKKDDKSETISVYRYFHEHHNVRLQYPDLPCVVVKNGAMLPIELCYVEKGQRYTAKLNADQTAKMIRFAAQRPLERVQQTEGFVRQSAWDKDPYLAEYGMKIASSMMDVSGRILNTPSICYGGNSIERPTGGSWNLRGKRFFQPARTPVKSWAVMCFTSTRKLPTVVIENFLNTYVQTLTGLGIQFSQKKPPIMYADVQANIEDSLKNNYRKAEQVSKCPPDYLFFIVDKNAPEPYGSITRICNTMLGIPSQCALSQHIQQAKPQYCANLGMKVNVKLGGVNTILQAKSNPLGNIPTLIIGADVYHPGVGSSGVSIASLVGSLNLEGSKYTAISRSIPRHQEVIDDMKDVVVHLLQGFKATTGKIPQRIIYFRDGTSEGQFKFVVEQELAELKAACQKLSPKYDPKVTVCTTQKRHHARFFIKNKQDGDINGNPLPGTIIEKNVTHPFEYDFYLISHPTLQGVSAPVHYTVLHDEINMPPDQFQALCYNLCYVYARSTTSVSLVPPVYYAHLVSNLAKYQDSTYDDTASVVSEEIAGEAVNPLLEVSGKLKTKMWFM